MAVTHSKILRLTRFFWTANDHHSIKVKYISLQDHRFLSFTFLSIRACVHLSVCLSTLCTPQFCSHNVVNPYSGSIYVQLCAIKNNFSLPKNRKKGVFMYRFMS